MLTAPERDPIGPDLAGRRQLLAGTRRLVGVAADPGVVVEHVLVLPDEHVAVTDGEEADHDLAGAVGLVPAGAEHHVAVDLDTDVARQVGDPVPVELGRVVLRATLVGLLGGRRDRVGLAVRREAQRERLHAGRCHADRRGGVLANRVGPRGGAAGRDRDGLGGAVGLGDGERRRDLAALVREVEHEAAAVDRSGDGRLGALLDPQLLPDVRRSRRVVGQRVARCRGVRDVVAAGGVGRPRRVDGVAVDLDDDAGRLGGDAQASVARAGRRGDRVGRRGDRLGAVAARRDAVGTGDRADVDGVRCERREPRSTDRDRVGPGRDVVHAAREAVGLEPAVRLARLEAVPRGGGVQLPVLAAVRVVRIHLDGEVELAGRGVALSLDVHQRVVGQGRRSSADDDQAREPHSGCRGQHEAVRPLPETGGGAPSLGDAVHGSPFQRRP